MSSANQNKDERMNLRLKHNAKQVLERAASFEGKTVSKFVLNSALSHARKVIEKHEIMTLNAKDSEAFYHALSSPAQFNAKLLEALESHDKRVTTK